MVRNAKSLFKDILIPEILRESRKPPALNPESPLYLLKFASPRLQKLPREPGG
jgi:hypothetical protein